MDNYSHIIFNNEPYIRLSDAKNIINSTTEEFMQLVEELELRNIRLQQQIPYYAKASTN